MLDIEIFRMQINRLESLFGETDPEVLIAEYYPIVKHMNSKRFAEVVQYIIENWSSPRHFPVPSFFVNAKRCTAKPYVEEKKIKRRVMSNGEVESVAEIARKFADKYRTKQNNI